MFFKRPIQRYGETPEPVTPYQKAAQVWDSRIGAATVQAANWRAMAFGVSAIALALSGGLIWLGTQSRVTPYVVEVDGQGAVRAVQPASTAYNPTDAQIEWFLGKFISNVRSLPIDPVVARKNWLEAYDFTAEKAAAFLSAQAQANDPFAGLGERSVTVTITSIVRASPTAFQVKWQEQAFTKGIPTGTNYWTAILSVNQTLPKREDVLRKNPLGLYVTEMAWSQDYGQPTASANP